MAVFLAGTKSDSGSLSLTLLQDHPARRKTMITLWNMMLNIQGVKKHQLQ